ncbi:MAG: 2-oxoacid:acceptor oxidoreductase family protein [Candidatus Omnitrophica bacterium]|nr:2-oxoacid:acceptor oxidoreductase family protein [Candidatus Omnitrophota bacterium]MDD5488224.1 2-oxoacid:acceptor oxidoreductase family protein [Candidatus Omnitrophota bacterium]
MLNESIICAGFGGQGIMIMGKVLASAGMIKGFNVTWMPSYGAEVRGGTAYSMVRISSHVIGSPMVPMASTVIAMNEPSMVKFEEKVKKDGLFILNSSLVGASPSRGDIKVIRAPLTEEAMKIGNVRVANIIAVGIYAAKSGIFDRATLSQVIEEFAGDKKKLIPINIKALEKGIEIAGEGI